MPVSVRRRPREAAAEAADGAAVASRKRGRGADREASQQHGKEQGQRRDQHGHQQGQQQSEQRTTDDDASVAGGPTSPVPTPGRKRRRQSGARRKRAASPEPQPSDAEASISAAALVTGAAPVGARASLMAEPSRAASPATVGFNAHALVGGMPAAALASGAPFAREGIVISSPFGSPIKPLARMMTPMSPSPVGAMLPTGMSPIAMKHFAPLSPLKPGELGLAMGIAGGFAGRGAAAVGAPPALARFSGAGSIEMDGSLGDSTDRQVLLDDLFTAELLGPEGKGAANALAGAGAPGTHLRSDGGSGQHVESGGSESFTTGDASACTPGTIRRQGSLKQTTRSSADMRRSYDVLAVGRNGGSRAVGATDRRRRPAAWRGSLGQLGDGLVDLDSPDSKRHSLDVRKLGSAAPVRR